MSAALDTLALDPTDAMHVVMVAFFLGCATFAGSLILLCPRVSSRP